MPDPLCSNRAMAKLRDATFRVQYLIKIYTASQEMRPEILSTELSNNIEVQDLQWLITQLEVTDFSALPAVEVCSKDVLPDAWSQYIPETNVIYLTGDFVENASKEMLVTVLLQETINAVRNFT